jgi:hypothetical protein
VGTEGRGKVFCHHNAVMTLCYNTQKGDSMSVRTTITLDEDILKLLKFKALDTSELVSSLVNAIIIDAFREDASDLKAFDERKNEETISYELLLQKFQVSGKL